MVLSVRVKKGERVGCRWGWGGQLLGEKKKTEERGGWWGRRKERDG